MDPMNLAEVLKANGFPENVVGKTLAFSNTAELIVKAAISDNNPFFGRPSKFYLEITLATGLEGIYSNPNYRLLIDPKNLKIQKRPGFTIK